jgi:hypothetical protein
MNNALYMSGDMRACIGRESVRVAPISGTIRDDGIEQQQASGRARTVGCERGDRVREPLHGPL